MYIIYIRNRYEIFYKYKFYKNPLNFSTTKRSSIPQTKSPTYQNRRTPQATSIIESSSIKPQCKKPTTLNHRYHQISKKPRLFRSWKRWIAKNDDTRRTLVIIFTTRNAHNPTTRYKRLINRHTTSPSRVDRVSFLKIVLISCASEFFPFEFA